MIPRGAEGIAHLSTRILADLIPKAADAYTMADLGMTSELVKMVAQDFDRAAANLVADQQDMREVFREALACVEEPALRERLSVGMEARPTSLRVRDLAARTDELMRILIDLHAAVEEAERAGAAWANRLNRRIWTFLEDHVARQTYDSGF